MMIASNRVSGTKESGDLAGPGVGDGVPWPVYFLSNSAPVRETTGD